MKLLSHRIPYLDPDLPLDRHEAIEISNLMSSRSLESGPLRRIRILLKVWMAMILVVPFILLYLSVPMEWALFGGLVAWLGVGIALGRVLRNRQATDFRAELRARGFNVCLQCGYWLRGHVAVDSQNSGALVCPECGHTLTSRPGMGLPPPATPASQARPNT